MDTSNRRARRFRLAGSLFVVVVSSSCGGQTVGDARDATPGVAACALAAATPPPPGGCAGGTVTFSLAGASGSHWLLDEGRSAGSSDVNWLSVFCPSGEQVYLAPTEGTTSRDCAACSATWSLTTQLSTWPLPPTDQTQTWDGTFFEPGTCGSQSLACVSPKCAPPGPYVAKVCACDAADQMVTGCKKPTCVDVPFNYPADGLVIALLPGG
ncbi:MAG: hypothetical protein WBY94_13760 [Polyangiaceae bacterium]